MKNFRSKVIAYGLMVVFAAALAPVIVEATCPQILVECPGGKVKSCSGTSDGQDGKVVFLIELETGFNFTL